MGCVSPRYGNSPRRRFADARTDSAVTQACAPTCRSPTLDARSFVSGEIWLGDCSGESTGFTRDVKIGGWTSVGDKLGGAYVGELVDSRDYS